VQARGVWRKVASMEASDQARTEQAKVEQAAEHAETIAALRARAEQQMSTSQRFVESFTANIGRPSSIAMLLAVPLFAVLRREDERGDERGVERDHAL
jgi:hypothetical protein